MYLVRRKDGGDVSQDQSVEGVPQENVVADCLSHQVGGSYSGENFKRFSSETLLAIQRPGLLAEQRQCYHESRQDHLDGASVRGANNGESVSTNLKSAPSQLT
ncbi:hypothetical protein AAG570_007089 [Ranatra chinensis]|uniref:Uncharacterized protein n=1 Tax=Ranatra chinensis TaxID=642074 RepID=A0ABD0XV59_9HEMI